MGNEGVYLVCWAATVTGRGFRVGVVLLKGALVVTSMISLSGVIEIEGIFV